MSTATGMHCRLGELIGRPVQFPSGEEIGHVEDFIVRLQDHSLCYTAISLTDDPQHRRRWVAVPCHAVTVRREDGHVFLTLHLQPDDLKQLPVFDPSEWAAVLSEGTGQYGGTFSEEERSAAQGARKKESDFAASAEPDMEEIGHDGLVDRLFIGPSGPGGPDKTRDF